MIYQFSWQQIPTVAETYCDTDFAGCEITRRSTSGGAIMLGDHCLKHWSSTQRTIALSSGEAELGGIANGAAHAMGFCSMARDLDINFSINVFQTLSLPLASPGDAALAGCAISRPQTSGSRRKFAQEK